MKTKLNLLIACLGAIAHFISPSISEAAEEIGFIETFALAEDRDEALKQLIPGTQEFYYFHALHAQNQGKHAEVLNYLEPWIKRYGETAQVWEIRNREALLKYGTEPKKSLDYLRDRMGLHFNHSQRKLNQKPNYPVSLNPDFITWEAFQKSAFGNSSTIDYFTESGLDQLLRSDLELDEKRRRALLARVKYPDYKRLVGFIAADLRTKESRGFGEFGIHNRLLPMQLDALLDLRPELINNSNFINANIRKLHPNADINWRQDDEARGEYLQRVWDYVQPLSAAFNSLKAHSLYQLLLHEQRQGKYSRELFITYLKLPRPVNYVEPRYLADAERRRNQVDMNANFQAVTMLPPIYQDEPLVRDFLKHFFVEDQTWEGYASLIRDTYLKPLFAETKLTNGIGDAAQWYSMLSPSAVQALKDRVDLEFALANETHFSQDAAVSLDIFVKNVDALVVKVYELNSLNYFLDQKRELNTDLKLDGLIANEEAEHDYDATSIRRTKRTFTFDSLKGQRGAWVIEFIGNGMSSRALVQKGRLQYLAKTTGAGTFVTVLDENNDLAKKPAVWFGGRKYTPSDKGIIALPFSNQPGNQQIVLTDGDFATLENLAIPSENYALEAGFYVDREALIPGNLADLVVRPSITVNGYPVPVSILEEVKLTIRSTDLDGIESVEEVPGFELKNDVESIHKFRVPSRVINLNFILEAKVTAMSGSGSKDTLVATDSVLLNTIDQRELVSDLHLSRIGGNYILEVLGKTGEAIAERAVNVVVNHEDFTRDKNFNLKTDENGRINLGVLDGIVSIHAQGNWLETRDWALAEDGHTLPTSVHGIFGQPIQIPGTLTAAQMERADFAIFEARSGTLVSDDFAKAKLEDGLISIEGLTPGDYELVLRNPEHTITVRVTDSKKAESGYALSKHRHLEIKNGSPLQIASISEVGENITIQTKNGSPSTRVHITASRFLPEYSVFENLDVAGLPEPFEIDRGTAETRYLSGRDIGEEYRYILERRAAKKFPGNMLTRPGLLLNPWSLRDTETTIDVAKAGESYKKSAESEPSSRAAKMGKINSRKSDANDRGTTTSNFDFLASAAPVILNVAPDANGVITIKRSDLGDRQHVHVVAIDSQNVAFRQVSLDEGKGTFFRDLRLKGSLELDKHFSQRRKVTQLGAGESLTIPDLRSSEFEIYDTVDSIYAAMMGVNGDETFAEFGFVLQWPDLPVERKRELYSKYSSHELNFFLSQRDPEFFEQVIQPYLAYKRDKTFMDHYLIGSDLAGYVEPWKFNRLNIPERILLARKLGGDEPGSTARHIQEIFELQPVNAEQEQFLFRSALRGRGMSGGIAGGGFGGGGASLGAAMDPFADPAPANERGNSFSSGGARVMRQLSEKAKNAPGASRMSGRASNSLPAAAAAPKMAADKADGLVAVTGALKMELGVERDFEEQELKEADVDSFGVAGDDLMAVRESLSRRKWFRKLESTMEWAENNYYHLPIAEQLADLISTNGFWRDFANWDGQGGFYSREFPAATRNFSEMMFALSVLDVPFKAGEHETKIDDNSLTFSAKSPVVVFHEEIEETPEAEDKPPLLVSENFFRNDDRYINIAGERTDKFVTDEFLTGVLYGSQVVVTNPTSSTQKLDLLLQVPQGALPVQSSDYTKTQHVRLAPFSTQKVETHFYFPSNSGEGTFTHYPVHLAKSEETVAWGDAFDFKVVDQLSKIDEASWDYLSQFATDREVLDYLGKNNVQNLDLGLIAWRCKKDVDFFRAVTALLDNLHRYDETLWSYGIFHNETPVARQYLLHREDFLRQCGQWIETELVSIAPIERHWYQHLEYSPLVNARTHRLGQDQKILNGPFRQQYQQHMKALSYKPTFDQDDVLAVGNYLLLQDRIEEGLGWLDKVNPQDVETKIQLDYLDAYASLYREEPQIAAQLAEKYEDYPVDRWQQRFAQIGAQVKEIQGEAANMTDNENRDQQQDQIAATEPGFELDSEGQTVTVNYRNLEDVVVNYYEMDLEFLFSSKPFVSGDSGQFSYIRPNQSAVKKLPKDKSSLAFTVPKEYASKNVLVEIVAAGDRKSTAVFANSLNVDLTENYGRIQVRGKENGQPMSKVYVKVYSRFDDGTVKFFKDGYTDLRGKFDYISLNTNELDRVEKFSLLIMSEKDGALVREAMPPQR